MTTTYDLIVIGAGPVGENVADYATKRGLRTVIVESELVGGECSYWACMPSKALLRSVHARSAALRVDGAKQAVTGDLDVAAVLRRRDSFVSDYDDGGQVGWLESAGIDLVRGHARLSGVRKVSVTTPENEIVELEATYAVAVSTGSAALLPDIDGLADAQPWTSREATGVTDIPDSIAIIGGGVVAAEMATAFAGLGSTVTVIARGGLLASMEPFAGQLVADALTEAGATLHLGRSPVSVRRDDAGDAVITLDDGTVVTAAEVLLATGRTPRTEDLGLSTVGLDDGDWLGVDDTLLVDAPTNADEKWLYAVGDVNHRALLTHQGKYQARAAGEVIAARAQDRTVDDAPWGLHVATADAEAVPQVTFTDPEVASVGLTEKAATDAGYPVRSVDYEIGSVSGAALQADGYKGTARLVIDTERDIVLGATFVGQDVADLVHSATIAVVGQVPVRRLWHAVPSYPTISEVWLRLLETYGRPES
ncbi:dihydrolipoyl dehydrogenase family protein [Amnibacterium flavum]|uniref:Pyridine nucleotide-disulfide oxidoreductase n=1 Tax=Amnibacterium flavum TaxID=2173173 RepID=A0A2V1HMV8_9MICO|nr:NAD(P)/FAD-dependent oxidoreductase [Amnibacterium flavum]PVZ93936.1 pyridine nucleotide-disulfide oxidoreductase [Amnibacterium flavum]